MRTQLLITPLPKRNQGRLLFVLLIVTVFVYCTLGQNTTGNATQNTTGNVTQNTTGNATQNMTASINQSTTTNESTTNKTVNNESTTQNMNPNIIPGCPPGQYYNFVLGGCRPCYPGCRLCYGGGSNQCNACWSPKAWYQGSCVNNCPSHYWKNTSSWNNYRCQVCDSSCLNCSGPRNDQCTSCPPMYFLYRGRCYLRCPPGTWTDWVNRRCIDCHPTCLTCTGPNEWQCTSCAFPRYLFGNRCVLRCPPGYYGNNRTRKCERCHFSCQTCDGPLASNCLSCYGFNYLTPSHTCVPRCPFGTYPDPPSKKCLPCHPTCPRGCTSGRPCFCPFPNFLHNGICQPSCPTGWKKNEVSRNCDKQP